MVEGKGLRIDGWMGGCTGHGLLPEQGSPLQFPSANRGKGKAFSVPSMAKRAVPSPCNPHFPALPKAAHVLRSEELAPSVSLVSRNSSWRCQQMSASDNETQSRARSRAWVWIWAACAQPALLPRGTRATASPVPGMAMQSRDLPAALCRPEPLLTLLGWMGGTEMWPAGTRPPGKGTAQQEHQAARAGGAEQGWNFPTNKWNVAKQQCWEALAGTSCSATYK